MKKNTCGKFLTAFMAASSFFTISRPLKMPEEKHFVIVCASYNNKDWYRWNLDSLVNQNYSNYHIIYIDDCSTDDTGNLVCDYIQERCLEDRITLICNLENRGAVANHYDAIHSCQDSDIIINVDGDDALADNDVLSYMNRVYADPNVWLTYGQFMELPHNHIGFCHPFPAQVIINNGFRDYGDIPSHMRTFYAGLYKRIKKEDLMINGQFYDMVADVAAMFPMIEMARDHFKFVNKIVYLYNGANPINDHKKSKGRQRELDLYIRSLPRYEKIQSPY
jgi:glycosyltransferase involved in cell wall biosynthesis